MNHTVHALPCTNERKRGDMPCGRESKSVSTWRLRPLVLMLALVLFSVMPRGTLSRGLALPPQPPPVVRNITCDIIPYPFGVRGSSLQGFEVTCGPNNEAMLKIDKHSYRIDYVSVEGGFVVILAGPISQVCYDRNGKQMHTTGIGNISLERTPFTFSKRNKLVAIGCNYRLSANFSNSMPGHSQWQPAICYSWCDRSSCPSHAAACCEADMPMDAAEEFTMTFDKIPDQITDDKNGTCSAAFFYDKDEQVFMGGQMTLKDAPVGDHGMILDWAIGGQDTCNQALNYNVMPLCKSLSDCIDAPRGVGYLCKCNAGYEGNPYAADGCVDIDECRTSDSNNCTFQNFCHNTDGGFTCLCPHNWTGDGYKTGTSCTAPLSSSGSPMQQPQGLNLCTHPEKNPCVYLETCSSDGEVAACDCPRGMGGDGRKKGKGCQKYFPLDAALGKLTQDT